MVNGSWKRDVLANVIIELREKLNVIVLPMLFSEPDRLMI